MGDLAHTFIGGGTPATNNIEFWDGSIPWLQSSDLIEDIVFNIIPRKFISKKALKKSATKLIPSNSITIVTRVGVGKLALIPYEFATSQDFISFSELKLDLIFASYAFYRLMKEESKSTQGTSIKGITKEVILNKYIYVPKSKEEQTQIGNFFKQLDDTIALHQRELEKFKILKTSYLENIFLGKVSLFTAKNTITWEQRKLGEFVSSLRSGLSRMLDSEDIGLPVIRANNINNGYVDLENDIKYWYQIDPMGANTRNYLVAKDDILINFINSESRMGSAAIMRSIPSRDTIYTTNILRLRLTSDLDPYWFYIQTQSKLYLEYIKSISKVAVNQASFTTVEFKNFTFFCPSTKEQTQIGNFFKQLDDTIALHQKELAKYQQIKTACLEKMFVE